MNSQARRPRLKVSYNGFLHTSSAAEAIDSDTYDGAEDSSSRHLIGYGATAQEAIADLLASLREA